MQRADQHVGEPRERLAGLLGRDRAREDARADQEHLLLREDADAIEEILVAAGLLERAVEPGRELRLFRQRAEEARIDHRVHHVGELREAVGKPRRGAEHQRDQRDQVGVLPQQREQPAGAVQAARKRSKASTRRVRIGGAREVREQQRHQLGELLARELALAASDSRRRASAAPAPRLRAAAGSPWR